MRAILLKITLIMALLTPAWAEDDPVSTVIQQQIDAFQADDFATAFTYASPMIKRMFQTPENFGMMVRQGYPMVHRPAGVTYLDQRTDSRATYQIVELIDQGGRAHYLEYEMVESAAGWQINGVRFVKAPSVGA